MASGKHEYWIASGHDELKSLHDGTMACCYDWILQPTICSYIGLHLFLYAHSLPPLLYY